MTTLTPGTGVPLDVPVIPGADDARRWAAEELAKKAYQDARPGLGAQLLTWLKKAVTDFLHGLGSLGGNTGLLVALCVVVLAVAAAVIVVRPRLNRRAAQRAEVFDGPATLSAGQHRDLARSAVERGDLATAVTEQFRAIVRSGEQRGATSPAPGRTAAEIAGELQRAFPGHGPALLRAAGLFNTVRYGHTEPTRAMYDQLAATDKAVAATKPAFADSSIEVVGGGWVDGAAAP